MDTHGWLGHRNCSAWPSTVARQPEHCRLVLKARRATACGPRNIAAPRTPLRRAPPTNCRNMACIARARCSAVRVVGCKFTDGQLASSKIYQFSFLNWLLPVKFRSVLFCWIRLCQACVARRVHHACIERASCTLTIARQRQQTVPWRLLLGTATATIAVYCVRHSMAAAGAPAPLRMSFSIGVSIKLQKLA